jgi:hypothetical protein
MGVPISDDVWNGGSGGGSKGNLAANVGLMNEQVETINDEVCEDGLEPRSQRSTG